MVSNVTLANMMGVPTMSRMEEFVLGMVQRDKIAAMVDVPPVPLKAEFV